MTEHQDIKEFLDKNAVSYNDEKYSQFSVTAAFAWHPDRILLQKSDDPAVKELQDMVETLAEQSIGSRVTFLKDAIDCAMLDYRHKHNAPCAAKVLVAFAVLTKAGDQLVYTAKLPAYAFHNTADLFEFAKDIVKPTSLKLVDLAIKDSKFKDVLSVKAYVGEVPESAFGGTNVPSEERS